jgi:hypothetical protein
MATPSTPRNFDIQQGNGNIVLTWTASVGATAYKIEKSIDNFVNVSAIYSSGIPSYSDTTAVIGTQYWYRVSATNDNINYSSTTPILSMVAAPQGEMSLLELRLRAQQRADRVGSNFVVTTEWNSYINQSLMELYDLLVDAYQDLFVAKPAKFFSDGSTYLWPLPNGILTFQDGMTVTPSAPFVAPAFHKLLGVDLGINNASNAWVTVNKFNFIDRNRFVYPNSNSTIYGVFNIQYRMMGNNIEFIPTPSSGQPIRIWYIPKLQSLLLDSDVTTIGGTGWLEYVITDAAIKALQKEESDVTVLAAQKMALIKRIEESVINRDAGQPDKISDIRQNGWWGSNSGGYGGSGPVGGF